MVFETEAEQANRIATAIEEGRPHAGAAFDKGFRRLNLLRRIQPRADHELIRLRTVVHAILPAQTPEQAAFLLNFEDDRDVLPTELRAAGHRSANLGSWKEAGDLEALASAVESLATHPTLARITTIRDRLRVLAPDQSNAEIRRWMSMALTPGDEILSNTGLRVA